MNSFINSLLTSSLNPVLRYLNADLDKLKILTLRPSPASPVIFFIINNKKKIKKDEIKGKAGIYR
jgi:hypothetical protein